ncbi:hypothetical protein ANCDUO_01535 [Ancylostoma duodenale]|uniref:Uncharacterized protein n=1 Tax=Ancylostoma duodenale TaxID=51022 RepID=A0A0C2H909_9BILA|nr:hypothetical protein ANCDUO_01535 [Ancylostoma duodenale]
MLSDAKDLADLLKMVAEKGQEIETNQQALKFLNTIGAWLFLVFQYLDSLAELIRQGIEAANEDLKKENDLRLQQEVTFAYNFFSEIGEILTTDVLYKNKRESPATSHVSKTQATAEPKNEEKEKEAPTTNEVPVTSEKTTVEQPTSIEEK